MDQLRANFENETTPSTAGQFNSPCGKSRTQFLLGQDVLVLARCGHDVSLFDHQRSSRAPDGAADWLSAGRFALLLGAFIFVMFPDVLLGSRTFTFRDFGLYGYPIAFYHREAFWRGEIPLWNPLSNCGIPFLAEWSTLALYPFSLFYLLLPLSWSLGVFCLLHLFLGGMGMYWLAERWTGNRLAAAVAGVAFAFHGFMLSCLIWPHYMVSMAWMPFVLLAVPRAWEEGGRWIVWAALAGSMQMLAGPPEVLVATWGLIAGLWFGQLLFETPSRGAMFLRAAAVVALITGLCAPQIFPFLDFLAHSQRDRNFGSTSWSMPGTGWANLLVPILFQQRTSAGVYMQPEQGIATSYYAGIGVLLLAVMALWWRRRWWCWFFAVAAVGCLTLAMGEHGYAFLAVQRLFPQIGFMRYPIKLVIPLTLIFPLMAAWALAAFRQADTITQQRRLKIASGFAVLLLALIGFLLWFSRAYPRNDEPWIDTAWNGVARGVMLLITMLILFLLARARDRKRQMALGYALVVIVWADLATHTPSQNPTVERSVYDPGLQTIQALNPKPAIGESRLLLSLRTIMSLHEHILTNAFEGYLCHRLAQFDNVNFYEHVPKVDGFYSLYLREEEQVRYSLYPSTNTYRAPMADFLSVSQITAPTNYFAFEARTNFMPMATAGQFPVFFDPTNTLAAMMQPNWSPRDVVFLRPEERAWVTVTNRTSATVIASNWTAHRVSLEVEARQPSIVVLSQAHYHPWKATVNGAATPVLRANLAFQAVQVPAGRSSVVLTYQDRLFRIGSILSILSMLICGIIWARHRPPADQATHVA